ncbi:MAG: GNAT family N-acetyltransferase [Clostridia bacterium]|nr:GNAT family N-acetyltransferase [Clostridia bacterium]
MEYLKQLTRLLSLEYNCSPEDFLRPEKDNVLTVPALKRGRRRYSKKKYFFHMCTLGGNAVITADECLHPFLSEFMREKAGYWLFEMNNLHPLEAELNRFGHTLTDSFHMFLSRERISNEALLERVRTALPALRLESFSEDGILPFYGHPLLKNAILAEFTPERPDRRLLCAYIGDELIAAAGSSEDAKGWMQIGVDVDERFRSKGLGTLLVNMLKNELLDEGFIPFYGTSVSNYRSWNIALNCGFRPAWVEIGSTPKER